MPDIFKGFNKILFVVILLLVSLFVIKSPQVAIGSTPTEKGKIIFSSDRGGGASEIYSMNEDGTGITQLTTQGSNDYASYSKDSSQIIFHSNRTGIKRLFKMKSDGSGQIQVMSGPDTAALYSNPKFDQNNSNNIVSQVVDPTQATVLYVIRNWNLTTFENKALAQSLVENGNQFPIFTPNGSRILYNRMPDKTIRSVNKDGTNDIQVGGNGIINNGVISISPDGQKIVFSSYDDTNNRQKISLMNIDGGGLKDLVGFGDYGTAPSFSPDGTKILFSKLINDKLQLFTMNLDGSGQTRLISSSGNDWAPGGTVWVKVSNKPGDVNKDGVVDIVDIGLIIDAFDTSPVSNPNADLNNDGNVNIVDLGIVIDNYDN